jgi:hypothetical protein
MLEHFPLPFFDESLYGFIVRACRHMQDARMASSRHIAGAARASMELPHAGDVTGSVRCPLFSGRFVESKPDHRSEVDITLKRTGGEIVTTE